ncbi:hypothetical protein DERP_011721 [Dermatophagoides pteronyssinus]|uniref:Uncharacterized protein n=1 Tax=Dermatophagoides pteronyssinus TaxID=6956 RepID=A0ABQ8J344_DERPT|nr:hypothetical protein DERP_011721 [Dermatophagoides pteronyssinus]
MKKNNNNNFGMFVDGCMDDGGGEEGERKNKNDDDDVGIHYNNNNKNREGKYDVMRSECGYSNEMRFEKNHGIYIPKNFSTVEFSLQVLIDKNQEKNDNGNEETPLN